MQWMIFKKQTEICHLLKLSGAGGYFQWNKPVHKEKKQKNYVLIYGSQTEDLVGEENRDEEFTPR